MEEIGRWWRSDWGHTGRDEGGNSDDDNEGFDGSGAYNGVMVAVAMGRWWCSNWGHTGGDEGMTVMTTMKAVMAVALVRE